MKKDQWCSDQREYVRRAYGSLPITFVRRVVFGQDPYWRRYFWSRWGWVPAEVRTAVSGGPVLWIDAISGGEVTQAVTFCKLLRAAVPTVRMLLCTNNRYSYDFAMNHLSVDAVMDSPWDCEGPVNRALNAIKPTAVIAVENVSSPVLFCQAHRRGITTMLVSGLMSKGFDRHPMLRRTIEHPPFAILDAIGAKTDEDADGFVAFGADPSRVHLTGNMKFDADYIAVSPDQRLAWYQRVGLTPDHPMFLGASLHPGEERLVGEAYLTVRQHWPQLELVLVPRYAAHIEQMEQSVASLGVATVRKTQLASRPRRAGEAVIVDTFGELSHLYAIATAAFLGGSAYLRNVVGLGQSIVEPLIHQIPVFFGPYMNLWRDLTQELTSVWPNLQVTTPEALADGLCRLLQDPALVGRLRAKAAELVGQHQDDIAHNVEMVVNHLQAPQLAPAVPC